MPLPIFPGKHQVEALVHPAAAVRHLGGAADVPPLPAAAVLVYSRRLVREVVARHPGAVRRGLPGLPAHHDVPTPTGPVALFGGFGIGGPAAALVLEEAIAAGARRVVSVGGAGGLDAAQRIGDVVVCDRALRDEGVSYHYLPPEPRDVRTDPALTERLRAALTGRFPGAVPVGGSWTTDAPYRESREEVLRYRAEGILTVEMEAASLAAVARHRGIAFATAFAVMDSLAGESWRPDGLRHADAFRSLNLVFDAAAEALFANAHDLRRTGLPGPGPLTP